jgi:hypothetical protein
MADAGTERPITLADGGATPYCVAIDAGATEPERHAAQELSRFLQEVTGAAFPVVTEREPLGAPALHIGQGPVVARLLPDVDLAGLGPEELLIRTVGADFVLTGGRPRGTLYAVHEFLEAQLGCRWWSRDASTIPVRERVEVGPLDIRKAPVLEYRESFWYAGFDPDWAVRNRMNGHTYRLDAVRGGECPYAGCGHTFYQFVPPAEHFDEHPEWFSEIGGKRTHEGGQLCLTNEELLDFMAGKMEQWLRDHPDSWTVPFGQNDWTGWCECAKCKALEEAEGGVHSGPMIHAVNRIAEGIEASFPHATVSVFAYWYSRQAPVHVRPRDNVIVQLCSIECAFNETLEHGEKNRSFADDIRAWSRISDRLYIWDYVTDFSHYLQPHPNLRVLGPNVRFFVEHGAKGIFEQGAYQSPGAEFAELRAWVLAKLLWEPYRDDKALIDEFLGGYYGDAAPALREYIGLMHDACEASGHHLGCFSPNTAPFLNLTTLTASEALFDRAEQAVGAKPDVLDRVRILRQGLAYIWVTRYYELLQGARFAGVAWSGPTEYVAGARALVDFLKAHAVTKVNEWNPFERFEEQVLGLGRTPSPVPPGCEGLPASDYIDLQDPGFELADDGATRIADAAASDGVAVLVASQHADRPVRQPLYVPEGLDDADAQWTAFAVVRCDGLKGDGPAFSLGLHDAATESDVLTRNVTAGEVEDGGYHVYEIGTARLSPQMHLWLSAGGEGAGAAAVALDRFVLTRTK